MGEKTKIGWTGSTWNPWIGCDRVSEGCANCYMERWAARFGRDPHEVKRSSARVWGLPRRLAWKVRTGEMEERNVFVCSLSDFFHKGADHMRAEAWEVIRQHPELNFQILTKRPARIERCLPEDWGEGWPNVWLGVSVESASWISRAELLTRIPAAVRFISMEPLVGRAFDHNALRAVLHQGVDWVIIGGESGAAEKVRTFHEQTALDVVESCRAEGVAVFVKQAGALTLRLNGDLCAFKGDLTKLLSPELLTREMPRRPAPNLHCWIEDTEGMTRKKFAELTGLHLTTIGLRCAPHPPPCGREQAMKIHKATGGAVSLKSLLEPEPCPRRMGSPAYSGEGDEVGPSGGGPTPTPRPNPSPTEPPRSPT